MIGHDIGQARREPPPRIPENTREYLKIPNDTKEYPRIPRNTLGIPGAWLGLCWACLELSQTCLKPRPAKAPRGSQKLPKRPRASQGFPKHPKASLLDFHRSSIKFVLKTYHFGALAGQGSIFIDFQLNFVTNPPFWSPGSSELDFH